MRKLKKIMITLLVVMIGVSVSAAASSIECSVAEDGRYNILSGKIIPAESGAVTIVINNAGRPLGEKINTVLIDETNSDNEGNFSFNFRIENENSGIKEYDYYLRAQNGAFKTGSFLWAGTETKTDFINRVKACTTPEELMDMFKENTSDPVNLDNRRILEIIRFDLSWYDEEFDQTLNAAWMESFIGSDVFSHLTSDNFAEAAHDEMAVYQLKRGRNIETALVHTNLGYENLDAQEQTFIAAVFSVEKPDSVSEMSEIYQFAQLLYIMKNGNANDIYNVIKNNHTILGLNTSDVYIDYTLMNELNKYSVCDLLVNKFKNSQIVSRTQFVEDFNSAVEEKMTENKNNSGSSLGGVGGTGGGSGDRIFSAPSVPVIDSSSAEGDYYIDLAGFEWAQNAIEALTRTNILSGDGSGNFNPADYVTREQFLTMIVRAAGLDTSAESNFDDVDSGAWFYPYISAGVKCGITVGLSNTEFGVGVPISRQDAAVMLKRVLDYQKKDIKYKRNYTAFADQAEISDYAAAGVEMLYRLGALNGYDDNTFRPGNLCTRAEAVKTIYLVFYGQEG